MARTAPPLPWIAAHPVIVACCLVLVSCGGTPGTAAGGGSSAPTRVVGVTITSALGAGEAFTWAILPTAQTISITQSGVSVKFPQALDSGTAYAVSQAGGPRTCTVTSGNATGTIGAVEVAVVADCGTPQAPVLPTITSFAAASEVLPFGGSTQLTAVFANGTGTISPAVGAVTSGVAVTVTPDLSTVYTLTVIDGAGHSATRTLIVFGEKPFEIVSISSDGLRRADYGSSLGRTEVTPDGRHVVFASQDDTLEPGDTNRATDIYLRDRRNATTERLSNRDGTGIAASGSSDRPKISDDGCIVVFESNARDLVPGDPTRIYSDIYRVDRCVSPRTVTRVSVDNSGLTGAGSSFTPDLSGDGRYVVFASDARLTGEFPTGTSVYMRDTLAGVTTLISRKNTGGWASGTNPVIDAAGTRVVFESRDDIVGFLPAAWQLYVYDVNATPHSSLVTRDLQGNPRSPGNESASRAVRPAISRDGNAVTYSTTSTILPTFPSGGLQQVYVHRLDTGLIRMESSWSWGIGDGDSPRSQGGRASVSGNGLWVIYNTSATNLAGGQYSTLMTNPLWEVPLVILPGSGFVGDTDPVISGDVYGRYVVLTAGVALDPRFSNRGIFLKDRHVAPVAVAGPPQTVSAGTAVTLDGSESRAVPSMEQADGRVTYMFYGYEYGVTAPPLRYTWTQTGGLAVILSDPHALRPTFTPPGPGLYRFKLIVNDIEDSAPSTVDITVR